MISIAQALSSESIFDIPQWKIGSGLVGGLLLILLAMGKRGWKILTSLHITVWTLLISVLLVFAGSWAQVNEGPWDAQVRWFKSWFIFRQEGDAWFVPPIFPGGHLLGTILLVNLLAAHARRFAWHFHKVGIQYAHLGIVVLLVGQFFTDVYSVESMLSFREGETKQYVERHRESELVFTTDTADGKERVFSMPEEMVADKAGKPPERLHAETPFSVQILDYSANGDVLERAEVINKFNLLTGALATVEGKFGAGDLPALAKEALAAPGRSAVFREALQAVGEKEVSDLVGATQRVAADPVRTEKLRAELKTRFRKMMLEANIRQGNESRYAAEALQSGKTLTEENLPKAATEGAGARALAVPRPRERENDSRNLPYAVVELSADGKPVGRWLVQTVTLRPQAFEAGGKKWEMSMRLERTYLPYTVKLLEATNKVYQGTNTPMDYRSRVLINNPATKEHQEKDISMNNPLRYAGLTFYQSQMGNDQRDAEIKTSGLQVVENPSAVAPYVGCFLVGFGLLWQFLWHLSKFFSKRMGFPAPETRAENPLLPVVAVIFVLPALWLTAAGLFTPRQAGSYDWIFLSSIVITLVTHAILAMQFGRGRYLGFCLFYLIVTTALPIPFAFVYFDRIGSILTPEIIAQLLAIAVILAAILNRPKTAPAHE